MKKTIILSFIAALLCPFLFSQDMKSGVSLNSGIGWGSYFCESCGGVEAGYSRKLTNKLSGQLSVGYGAGSRIYT